jgi:hypothetical protein
MYKCLNGFCRILAQHSCVFKFLPPLRLPLTSICCCFLFLQRVALSKTLLAFPSFHFQVPSSQTAFPILTSFSHTSSSFLRSHITLTSFCPKLSLNLTLSLYSLSIRFAALYKIISTSNCPFLNHEANPFHSYISSLVLRISN